MHVLPHAHASGHTPRPACKMSCAPHHAPVPLLAAQPCAASCLPPAPPAPRTSPPALRPWPGGVTQCAPPVAQGGDLAQQLAIEGAEVENTQADSSQTGSTLGRFAGSGEEARCLAGGKSNQFQTRVCMMDLSPTFMVTSFAMSTMSAPSVGRQAACSSMGTLTAITPPLATLTSTQSSASCTQHRAASAQVWLQCTKSAHKCHTHTWRMWQWSMKGSHCE